MTPAKIVNKAKSVSVALFSILALSISLTLLSVIATHNKAFAGPDNVVYDDMDKNTETCRREYPQWDHPDFLDVWFDRDDTNSPICLAQTYWHSRPIILSWPQGGIVSVITFGNDCYCDDSW